MSSSLCRVEMKERTDIPGVKLITIPFYEWDEVEGRKEKEEE